MNKCPLCNNICLETIYQANDIPIFQNKVYESQESAKNSLTENIELVQCISCGFIFNKTFNSDKLNYDEDYHNEQTNSEYYKNYLMSILKIIDAQNPKKIIEIGCGKGYFLELLRGKKYDAIGFDPAYEGKNNYIIKDYFSEKYQFIKSDLIILRHTLEHIENPLDFLHMIAKANNHEGSIYIEVPLFDWIIKNNAFWDIYYEHCNYFNFKSLSSIFKVYKRDILFNEQYFYVLAGLKNLKKNANGKKNAFKKYSNLFKNSIEKYNKYINNNKNIIIWGAAAKGSTFANLLDRNKKQIKYFVDMNPKKQNKFIATSGHKIYSPEHIKKDKNIGLILVMNKNYMDEIIKYVNDDKIKIVAVEEINDNK